MNKIYLPLIMALALALLALWRSNEKKEKEPFCVTYHVAVHTLLAHKMIITYTNDKGIVQEPFIGKRWEKQLCLFPDGIASLRIDEIIEPKDQHHSYLEKEQQDTIINDKTTKPISIWIEHTKKTVSSSGYKHLQVFLLASDVDK